MSAQRTIEIIANGEARNAIEGQTLLAFVEELGLDPARVAVEMDGAIVKRSDWPAVRLHPGARLEIVQFVGGG